MTISSSCHVTVEIDDVFRSAVEWMGFRQGSRVVAITMDPVKVHLLVRENGSPVRMIDMSRLARGQTIRLVLSADVEMKMMLVGIPNDYDLVGGHV